MFVEYIGNDKDIPRGIYNLDSYMKDNLFIVEVNTIYSNIVLQYESMKSFLKDWKLDKEEKVKIIMECRYLGNESDIIVNGEHLKKGEVYKINLTSPANIDNEYKYEIILSDSKESIAVYKDEESMLGDWDIEI